MQRMIQSKNDARFIAILVMTAFAVLATKPLVGQAPMVRHADADFEASGYVTPAGMVPPSMYRGAVSGGPIQQVGYSSPCDGGYCGTGGCDSCGPMAYGEAMACGLYGGAGCDSYGGCGSCGGNCGPLGCGGILGKLTSHGSADGLSPLCHLCVFCRGGGCGACQFIGKGYLLGAIQALLPYTEAGLCAQRWYDISAEAVFLSHNNGTGNFATTSQGPDVRDINGALISAAPRVLNVADADSGGDLEAGFRLSAAMIFGAGGNLEGTYLGSQTWDSSASVADPGFGLFSFISNFGTDPLNGFDDTDRSRLQTITTSSEFHSGELNYRRRTVGPYCRFQGSWLVGLRYLRFDNGVGYSTLGANDNTVNANLPRFFSSNEDVKNNLFGAQAGFDLWWNMIPGINVGFGMKGAWVQNDIDHRTLLTANSLGGGGTPGTQLVEDSTQDTTVVGEMEAKVVYRLSHSWSIRSAYYLIAVQDAAFAGVDVDTIRNFVDPINNPNPQRDLITDDLVLQGFSLGAEYIW